MFVRGTGMAWRSPGHHPASEFQRQVKKPRAKPPDTRLTQSYPDDRLTLPVGLGRRLAVSHTIVGRSVPRVDARQKVTGEALYTGDMRLPGTLRGLILRSPVPHARLVKLDVSEAERLPGVLAVVTCKDAMPVRIGRFLRDGTPLAVGKVRHIGEPIAAVAAVDRAVAEKALALIKVTYEELPAVFDPWEALKPGAPIIHEELASYQDSAPSVRYGNVRNEVRHAWGDMERALAEADLVLEESYTTQAVHASYMEPRAALALADASGKLTIWCSTKAPFPFRGLVAQALGLSLSKVRVIAPTVGGDYGGKGLATIEPICALLARKSGRPVLLELSRQEELTSSSVRHPAFITLKTAMKKDGTLLAVQGQMLLDGGAYNDAVMGLASSSFNLLGPYKAWAVDLTGRTVYTNNIPSGHVRGPGAPQTLFAIESQMDIMARRLGLDPWEVRRRNAVEDGSSSANGRGTLQNVGLRQCLDRAWEVASGLLQKDGPHQGIGVACGQWQVLPGGETIPPSQAMVVVNEDGSATVLSGITEQGGGQYTVMAQIAAEELGLPLEDIALVVADTDTSPIELGTGGSATTLRVGNNVRFAAQEAKDQLLALASERLEASVSDLVLDNKKVYVRGAPDKAVPVGDLVRTVMAATGGPVRGDSVKGQQRHLAARKEAPGVVDAPSYGVQVVKVQVDPETGEVRLLSLVTAQDAGFALNPMAVEGQVEGGIGFGLGYGLSEEVRREGGKALNQSLMDYRLPTAVDMPEIKVTIVEQPSSLGPYGAKGVGETGAIPTAPALANAIEDAVGVRITKLPITPEKVLRALRQKA